MILSWQSVSETIVSKREKKYASSFQSIARKFSINFQIYFVPCGDGSREQICTNLELLLTGKINVTRASMPFECRLLRLHNCHEADPDYR